MKRLSILERGRIAQSLRHHVLQKKDKQRLQMVEDPATAPSVHIADAVAFEWWLDVMRKRVREAIRSQGAYNAAWVQAAFQQDDIFRTPDKIARVALSLFNQTEEERGAFTRRASEWFESDVGWDSPEERDDCIAFVHEVIQEIFLEFVREYIVKK